MAAAAAGPGRVRVLTVCGHGREREAGIELWGGELWDGTGCDFDRVELLVQVSCSMGRVAQSGAVDATGFCLQLAVHNARSVAAGRWPLHSHESVRFAEALVENYLRLRQAHPDRTGLRAEALNQTRNEFLDGKRGGCGWNTAAAFELYGLG